ncbi:MAG: TlpA family protein disulfide reductase [Gammaproteobacteria bacterium]|jgi:thiol-disulfide isomerase/thioredoxin|nr:TlpA family protein disulfide reductase [Gammaproteobacteria bacterium]
MRKFILPLLVAIAAGAAGFSASRLWPPQTDSAAPASVSENVDFSLPDLDGELHAISAWRGKPLLVNFWATWCGPCREEIPLLVDTDRSRGEYLQVLGVAIDNPDAVREFAKEFSIRYPNLIAEMGASALLASHGNPAGALPFTLLLDAEGVVLEHKLGALSSDEINAWADKLH